MPAQDPPYSAAEPEKMKIGLAINGGMLVAAAGGAAIMRGFQQKTIIIDGEERPAMEAFDCVSGLSGGNITVMLYAYAQNANSNELLDAEHCIDGPSQITPKVLNRNPHKSIFQRLTKSMVAKLGPLLAYEKCIGKNMKGAWPVALWQDFLQPYGIKRNQPFGTSSENEVVSPREEVKAEPLMNFAMLGEVQDNGNEFTECEKKMKTELDKLIPKPGTYVAEKSIMLDVEGGFFTPSQISEVMEKVNNISCVSFTVSPSDVGTGHSLTMIADSGELQPATKLTKPSEWGESNNHFSLELALAMGTWSYPINQQQQLYQFGNVEKNMIFGDGGIVTPLVDIHSLVRRNVRKIIIPMWGYDPGHNYIEIYKITKNLSLSIWASQMSMTWISSYFGFYAGTMNYQMSQIFDEGEMHLQKLRESFDDLFLAGKPLVTTLKDVKVIDNPFYGVVGGGTVDLTIMYVTMPRLFGESVPRESVPPREGFDKTVDESGYFTNLEMKDFPNFDAMNAKNNSFSGNKIEWIKGALETGIMTTRQTNMMACLGSWLIDEAWEGVSIDGKEYFGGFKEILQA